VRSCFSLRSQTQTTRKPSTRSLQESELIQQTGRKPSARSTRAPQSALLASLRCLTCRASPSPPRPFSPPEPRSSCGLRHALAIENHRQSGALTSLNLASLAKTPTLPAPGASAPGHASFSNRRAGGALRRATRRKTRHASSFRPTLASARVDGEGQGLQCCAVPGGLKGRGEVREPRSRKHARNERAQRGPRDRSAPRAFWLLLSPFLPAPKPQNHPLTTHARSDGRETTKTPEQRIQLSNVPVLPLAHAAPAVEDELLAGRGEFLDVGLGVVVVGVVDPLVLLEGDP